MKKFLKWSAGILLILVLVVGGLGVFLYPKIAKWQESMANRAAGTEVLTMAVARDRLVRTVSAPGDIEPRRKVQISARVSAQITELPFKEGDVVREGEIVVRLDDKDLRAALDSARASMRAVEARLEGARASHVNATSEWERQSSLYKTADVSRSSMEDSEVNLRRVESDLRAQEQNVEVARAQVEQAEQAVAYATLAAPMTGRITRLNSEVCETVTGSIQNFGTVIMEIADLSEMLVKAEIDETDVAPVKSGQSARVFINAFPDEVFEGTVETIALQHSFGRDQSKFFATEVLLHLDPEHNIYSGLTANVDVEVETLEGVLKVPSQAVLDKRVDELPAEISGSAEIDKNKTFARVVYVLRDGKAVETPVRIGPSDLTQTAVLAGLADGDEVIIGPWKTLQELEHNKSVRRREPEKTEAPAVAEGQAEPTEAADSAETTDETKKDEKSSDATKADADTDGDASS